MRGNYKSFEGTNLTVVEGTHQFITYILYVVQPVRRGRSVRRGGVGGGSLTALGRKDVGACYTRGAGAGEGGGVGGGGAANWSYGMDG